MRIAITSPAGKVDSKKMAGGISFLKSLGHELILGETLNSEEFWTAGSAGLRAAELERYWCDEDVDVVWAARGGFGCAHLLDKLDWKKMSASKKILCGHSDISVLHLAFKKFGLNQTFSTAMPAVEFSTSNPCQLAVESTFDLIGGSLEHVGLGLEACRVRKVGEVEGDLVPVTLSVLCSLIGTGYIPDLEGAVLVIEDINESAYRLDGYLNHLRLSGILGSLGALVFGDFNNCGEDHELKYVFAKYAMEVNGPVLEGLPFGHCEPRLSLPVGQRVKLKADKSVIECNL